MQGSWPGGVLCHLITMTEHTGIIMNVHILPLSRQDILSTFISTKELKFLNRKEVT